MPFSNEEAYDMLRIYFQCFENAAIASREYSLHYPLRRPQSRKVFRRLAGRLLETGCVQPVAPLVRTRRVRTEENITAVLACVRANPQTSIRDISRDSGLSYSIIQKILTDQKMHPYHVELHQALTNADFDSRLNYCHWINEMLDENPHMLSQILWTDEASFCSDGKVNLHNMHYWADQNPHFIREVDHQHRFSVHVWCGILNGTIIGPHFFQEHLTSELYLDFLRNVLPGYLEEIPLNIRRCMWFQHDGCPAHYGRIVRQHLDESYPNRWIGRGSIFPWPPRSPDLTCLDFYLWGRVKELVYATAPTTPENMIFRIRQALNTLSRAEIEAAVLSTRRRINKCIENDGKHFENNLII